MNIGNYTTYVIITIIIDCSLALIDLKSILLSNPNDKSVQEEIKTIQVIIILF